MSRLKLIFTVVMVVGVAGMMLAGQSEAQVGVLLRVGIGLGTAVSGLIAIFKRS